MAARVANQMLQSQTVLGLIIFSQFTSVQLLRKDCAIVAHRNPGKQGEVLGN